MRRRRSAQLLISCGLTLAVVASLAAGALLLLRTTSVVAEATPALLEIPEVRERVRAELVSSIRAAYQPVPVADAVLGVAAERVLENGYVIDEFAVALDDAHRAWLGGGELAVELDPAVVTRAARTGLSDADPAFATANPLPGLVAPAPVTLAWDGSAESSAVALRVAGILALGGLVLFVVGAIVERRAGRPLKAIARAVVVLGASVLIVGLVPFGWVVGLDPRVASAAALVAPIRLALLVAAGVILFCGLWLHTAADRIVAGVVRTVGNARRHSDNPVASGGRRIRRQSTRRRAAAIDAFFDADDASSVVDASGDDPAPTVVDARDDADVADEVDLGDDRDAADGDEGPPDRPAPTPEQERAEALAVERREALERIDGTKSGYRTHLGR